MDNDKNEEFLERNRLNNDLDQVIFFRIKHIAGDRCQVTFAVEIDVDIKADYFKNEPLSDLDINHVRELLGEKTSYKYSKVRNFIAEDEKEKIFEGLKQQFLDSNLSYISSAVFPVKLIKRNYIIAQKEETNRLNKEAYFKNA